MPVTLLAASDIHLGRRPSRLPESLEERSAALSPAEAWRSLVREAVDLRVDALLLAGDVVDSEDDRFGALAVLEPGIDTLLGNGIDVVAVAGNHDVHALPRLAALLGAVDGSGTAGSDAAASGSPAQERRGRFVLLGADGTWERVTIRGRDGTALHVLGRSFREPRERSSPLDALPGDRPRDGTALLGLLHCDVDGGPASAYAPAARRELENADVDAWLLGHVHVPGAMTADRPIGYLGSLTGLDPGEPGERGAWLVRVAGPGRIETERVRVAPLRWEIVEIDAAALDGDAAGPDDDAVGQALERLVRRGLDGMLERVAPTLGAARAVGCRVRLAGRTKHERAVRRLAAADDGPRDVTRSAGDVVAFVESIEVRVLPAIDLEALAATSDPPGLLARALIALRDGGETGDALVADATRRAADAADGAHWNRDGVEPDPATVRALLLDAGFDALGALLEQAPGAGGAR